MTGGWNSPRCTPLASVWSASLHEGIPTAFMFSFIASATGRLKCCGHAAPRMRHSTVVSVMAAAALAMALPASNKDWMCG